MKRTRMQIPASRGFTLLELLIAMSIFATLSSVIIGLFFSAYRMRERAWESIQRGYVRQRVVELVQKDLRNLVAPNGELAGAFTGEAKTASGSETDELVFYATTGSVNDAHPWGEIQKIEYYLAEPRNRGEKGFDFVRKTTQELLSTDLDEDEDHDEAAAKYRLLHNVESLIISYYDGDDWSESWDSAETDDENPLAVSITISFVSDDDNKNESPLELVVETAVQSRESSDPTSSSDDTESASGDSGDGVETSYLGIPLSLDWGGLA